MDKLTILRRCQACLLVAGVAFVIAGCGGGGGGSSSAVDSSAPSISTLDVQQRAISGGTNLSVGISASDTSGISHVSAFVYQQGGSATEHLLSSAGGGGYSGSIPLPRNMTTSDQTYYVYVVVQDNAGNRVISNTRTVVLPGLLFPGQIPNI